jgi:hypothetical protein
MSAAAFQAALGRLVADASYREAVRAEGEPALRCELDAVQRRRLLAVAASPGLDITSKVHEAWRLGKLYTMLPLTCALLGEERLGREVDGFWRRCLPRSFYFRDEALEFCDHLARRLRTGMRVSYLREVLAYESTVLELRRPFAPGEGKRIRSVAFRHDPARLIGALRAGERPRRIPTRPCLLVGTATPGKDVEWEVIGAAR